jgi:hypothetical protein
MLLFVIISVVFQRVRRKPESSAALIVPLKPIDLGQPKPKALTAEPMTNLWQFAVLKQSQSCNGGFRV